MVDVATAALRIGTDVILKIDVQPGTAAVVRYRHDGDGVLGVFALRDLESGQIVSEELAELTGRSGAAATEPAFGSSNDD